MKITDRLRKSVTPAALIYCLSACSAAGPDYVKPKVEIPSAYKEQMKDGVLWKQARPGDNELRGDWWKILSEREPSGDRDLDALESQIDISNQNIKEAEASFQQAQAAVSAARSSFFPQVRFGYSDVRGNSQPTSNVLGFNTPGVVFNDYTTSLSASWEIDVWGRIRRQVEARNASSEASDADVKAARLSAQAELATAYINLRFTDGQKRLLDDTVKNDEQTLKLTQNLHESGIGRRLDVAQAQEKLESDRAQAIDTGVQRAQYEHAIAVLIGKAPASFSIPPSAYVPQAPYIPPAVPSELLERRPDIAAAERKTAAANAQIGVAQAAFYPSLELNASGGFQSFAFEHFSQLLSIPQRFWSIGPSINETIFDAGLHSAQKAEAVAAYDQSVATYRQTVLNGFKEVEDNLAALRVLKEESAAQQKSIAASHEAETLALNLYKAESGRYSDVLTAQSDALKDELTALNTQRQQLLDSVALVKALGGIWGKGNADDFIGPPLPPALADNQKTPKAFVGPSLPHKYPSTLSSPSLPYGPNLPVTTQPSSVTKDSIGPGLLSYS